MGKQRESSPDDRAKADRLLEQAKKRDEAQDPTQERRPGIRGNVREDKDERR